MVTVEEEEEVTEVEGEGEVREEVGEELKKEVEEDVEEELGDKEGEQEVEGAEEEVGEEVTGGGRERQKLGGRTEGGLGGRGGIQATDWLDDSPHRWCGRLKMYDTAPSIPTGFCLSPYNNNISTMYSLTKQPMT